LVLGFFLWVFAIDLFGQENFNRQFTLEWKQHQKIYLDTNTYFSIPIIDDGFIDFEKKLPQFFRSWEVPAQSIIHSYRLDNVVYETLNASQLSELQIQNIPNKMEAKLEVVSTRNKNEAFLTLIPLVKEGNQIKKIISFNLSFALQTNNQQNRNKKTVSNSVLSSGKWYKIAVDTTGVYKIDRSFLNNLGINVGAINPKNIQIYGNGGALLPYKIGDFRYEDLQENAIYIEGEDDEKFDTNDFILFYAKGPESWKHNNTTSSLSHVKNIYSDKAYYFIFIANEPGKRIQNAPQITGTPTIVFQNYDDYWVYEKDMRNLFSSGQQWLGEGFDVQNQRTFTHTFTNLDTSFPVTIKTRVVGISQVNTSFQLAVNGTNLSPLFLSQISGHTLATSTQNTASTILNSENINLSLTFSNNGNAGAKGYLDFFEIIGKKKLIASNKQFSFRNFAAVTTSGILSYQIQNASNIFQLWDVTDPTSANEINNKATGTNFEFNANGGQLREYIVLISGNYYIPTRPSDYMVSNQNLHSLTDVDYLIITKSEFVNEAEILAQHHRIQSNLNVKVIPLHEIYNEFGSGSPDITAIRDFVRHIFLNSNNRLKYLLLYGDASFDFKGISNKTESIIPTFEAYNSFDMTSSFVTDDFFGIVSDLNEGDLDSFSAQTMDIAVSRIPFNTSQEAHQITSKIINYYHTNSLGDWRNELLMIADDIDTPSDEILQVSQENLSDLVKLNKPLFNIKKVWMDAFTQEVTSGGSRYPQVNAAIDNSIDKGILMIDYFGHGGEDGLTLERIVETDQIEGWNNLNQLNLLTVISCEFARFDNPLRPNTAGELTIRNSKGGAGHLIATAREIFINVGMYFNQDLLSKLLEFNNVSNSISENLRLSKNTNLSSQRYFIFSFGDPAMKLAVAKPNVLLTHMNGVPVSQTLDTIKALSHISFDGMVTTNNGSLDTNFNGELYLTVYDKPMDRQTLNNDGNAQVMTFDTQDSKIFRGRASVNNGIFHIEFVAPQDIRIAYGKGKLSFYAHNTLTDKGGFNTDINIGGIDYNATTDHIGPTIKLFMNDKSFLDGGNTNQSPLFLAFLEDENGINTSFSSVDHDITATLDNDQQNPIILNDYYISDINDYTKGNLEYRLRDLEVGPHIIQLKAYDTYNNPSEATLNFVVVDDAKMILEHVLNYPNPFVNYTEFWFNHNKPNEPLEVQVQIYTVSGKLVKTINQTVQNSGSLSREITWDGLDDFGQKIGKGVYIFKLSVKATLSNLSSEKFEKLVILQ
jgi:hypothetical protein